MNGRAAILLFATLICAAPGMADDGGYENEYEQVLTEAPSDPSVIYKSGLAGAVIAIHGMTRLLPLGTQLTLNFDLTSRTTPDPAFPIEAPALAGGGLQLGLEAKRDHLEPSLARYIKFTATGLLTVSVGIGARTGVLELDGRLMEGKQVEYEVRMPEMNGETPSLFRPEEMPVGTEIVLEVSRYKGLQLSAAFHAIAMEDNHGEFSGLAIGVEKIGPRRVRVLTGPVEGVRDSSFIGRKLGKFIKLNLGRQGTLKRYRLRTAEIQLDTEGARQTYNQLWLTGQIVEGMPGLERMGTISKFTGESASSIGAGIGPVEVTHGMLSHLSNEGTRTETRYFDSDEWSREFAISKGNRTAVINTDYAGNEILRRNIDIVYRDLDGEDARKLRRAFMYPYQAPRLEGRWDAHITFDEAQAIGFRDIAVAGLKKMRSGYFSMLAEAPDGAGIVKALVLGGDIARWPYELTLLSFQTRSQLPGSLALRWLSRPQR